MIPTISVIVPVYNVEKYLHRCIDSILIQSFTDFELLLIDDGSPDNCGAICDEYAAKDARVRVFHKKNGGVSSARNLGLDSACGKYIVFIDSDDYVSNDYLEELLSYRKGTNSDLIAISRKLDALNSKVTLSREKYTLLFSLYKFYKSCPPWGKLYCRDIIEQYNLRFNTQVHLGEDVMFVLTYLLETQKITLISSDKYFYEVERPDSLTKVINSYNTELAGKKEYDRIADLLMTNLMLDEKAIFELEGSRTFYTERTLSSIMRLPKRSNRISKIRELDLTLYHKHKKPYSWKEGILLFLLRNRWFYLYDLLLSMRRK